MVPLVRKMHNCQLVVFFLWDRILWVQQRSFQLVFREQQVKINLVLFNAKHSLPLRSCKVKLKPIHGYFILLQCAICCQTTCALPSSGFIQRPLELIAGSLLVWSALDKRPHKGNISLRAKAGRDAVNKTPSVYEYLWSL